MYTVWPDSTSPLGTPEQVKRWLSEAQPLIAEVLYPEIDYDIASVLTFGSAQDRAEVKRILRQTSQEEEIEEEVEEEEEKEEDGSEIERLKKQVADANMKRKVAEEKAAALEKKTPEEEKIEKSAKARAEVEEEEKKDISTSTEKKSPEVKEDMSTPEDITATVAKIRAKHKRNK